MKERRKKKINVAEGHIITMDRCHLRRTPRLFASAARSCLRHGRPPPPSPSHHTVTAAATTSALTAFVSAASSFTFAPESPAASGPAASGPAISEPGPLGPCTLGPVRLRVCTFRARSLGDPVGRSPCVGHCHYPATSSAPISDVRALIQLHNQRHWISRFLASISFVCFDSSAGTVRVER